MYYKIENKNCDVYNKLYELRTKEIQIKKDNEQAIEEKTGLKFETFLGYNTQQNFRRVPQYEGFKFKNTKNINLKIWKEHPEHKDIFVPNRKTKLGREMSEFILNGLKGSRYDKVFKILNIQYGRKFTFPFVEIVNGIIVIFLGDDLEPKDKNIIEITKREFNELMS